MHRNMSHGIRCFTLSLTRFLLKNQLQHIRRCSTYLPVKNHIRLVCFPGLRFSSVVEQRQSPVDIKLKSVTFDPHLKDNPLTINYQSEDGVDIENSGATVVVNIKQNSVITGGPLSHNYRLIQYHLHWGCSNERGSEHTVDGQKDSGELHLVHWNTDKYGSFQEAVNEPDGLAVFGALIKLGEEHPGFKPITDNMDKITKAGSTYHIAGQYNPDSLLTFHRHKYYTYPGSLTTPLYNECVTWIVSRDPFVISQKQMEALRSLKNSEGKIICDNFRETLPLYNRQIRASFT